MKNSTLIHDFTPDEINSLFQGLQKQISELKENFEPKVPTEWLTRTEVSEMLKCDISTVHNWTVKGKLIPYGIGNRVFYKRSEVEKALIPFGKNKGGGEQMLQQKTHYLHHHLLPKNLLRLGIAMG